MSLPNVDPSGVHTTSARIGSSAESVVRTLGNPLVITLRHGALRQSDYNDPTRNKTMKIYDQNDRVIEIADTSWG